LCVAGEMQVLKKPFKADGFWEFALFKTFF